MKTILGLDLGTNSIGWALIQHDEKEISGKVIAAGSRILPMSQDVMGKFDSGVSISQTAERTGYRGIRRLRERHLLRRERLHRVLYILGFLPEHFAKQIDFAKRVGQFLPETEPKLPYIVNKETNKSDFIFKKSFEQMLDDFTKHQPQLLKDGKKIPYDWTIYYLRKKALSQKIEKEELAWLLLNFNQKRGYYQLRGEEEEENPDKRVEFYSLRIAQVTADEPQRGSNKIWYNIILENGWVYRRESNQALFDWKDKVRDFIVTTDLNEDGSIKKDKEGNEKRSFRSPKEDDWKLLKKKTESEIDRSKKTVGEFIYDTLLQKPDQKIKGKLIRTIERKFYKEELIRILKKQIELNSNLKDTYLYKQCVEELYPHNLQHQSTLISKDFLHLFIEDILYYQRPLRSQKSTISNCPLERRTFILDGIRKIEPLKCISKSHPLYQEFRLWQWISNLRIINKDNDWDETAKNLELTGGVETLFDFLTQRKEIDQKALLKYFKLKETTYRWNYVEDKSYPCNETHTMIAGRLAKVNGIPQEFLTKEKEEELWHVIYSVTDKLEYEKALKSFAVKKGLEIESFFDAFRKFPPFPANYGSYSAKAIKKLLPLMRMGEYWDWDKIDKQTKERIGKFIDGEFDEQIKEKVREKIGKQALVSESDYQGLPEWLAKYVVYDRHSEHSEAGKWNTVTNLEEYLRLFRQHSLKNPIVEQVMMETLRTVKDIWNYYGNGAENFFDEIHIELGREMKNTKSDRERISKQNVINENTNLRVKALLIELLNDNDIENVRPYSPMQQDILKIYEDAVLNDSIEIPEDIEKISKLAQPTSSQLQRYKLWLEQKYRSPYTGAIIPLNKLFTPAYEIEHIIPQSRYYDDSFNNKVICEAAVNKLKDNQTGLEFIQNHHGQIVGLGMEQIAKIFTENEYTDFVKQHYTKSRAKKNNLMALDIPEKMIERQLNDTRYISKFIMQALSNIVRTKKDDDGGNSKNVLASNGKITSDLKRDWGMDAIWNELILPRFERLNNISNSTNFTAYNDRYQKYLPVVPFELQKGFQKKRIDHRHHAMDALIIACATRSHINFMNNKNALDKKKSSEQKQNERFDLKKILCDKKYNSSSSENYEWVFKQPWGTFVPDAKEKLEQVIISFKQNLRVINKSVNHYQTWNKDEDGKLIKQLVKQTKGDSWAVRKPMHKDTVSGLVQLKFKKIVSLSSALDNWTLITHKAFRKYIQELLIEKYDKKKILKIFKEKENKWNGLDVSRPEIFYWDKENVASRVKVDESFSSAKIETITDTGIQKIMLKHLNNYTTTIDEKITEHPELAFAQDGLDQLNKNLVELNNGKQHQPIYKVRTYEPKGNKFNVGIGGNKKDKFVEAAKGTNLYFAIYADEAGKRNYSTVPLNEVIELQKQGLSPVPEFNALGNKLLSYLSPNDLVYVPDAEEKATFYSFDSANVDYAKIYKIVSFTGNRLYAIPCNVATSIVDKLEYTLLNKLEFSLEKISIKESCIKLKADRLGFISLA